MVIKWYSTFFKALGLEPHHQFQFSVIYKTVFDEESYLFAEMQSVHSTDSGE